MDMDIKVGCCGFPGGMEKYFQRFELVEVQKTFYNPPKLSTAEKWRKKAPKEFEFSVKAWQLITHLPGSPTYRKAGVIPKGDYGFFKPTEEVFDAWEKTREICAALKTKLVVFQCPPSFRPTKENIANMKDFFSSIERNLKLAWEPRGEWEDEVIKGLCEELDLIHCVDPFARSMARLGDTAYFRLHGLHKGGRIDYRYRYTKEDLRELLDKCNLKRVYCLFNNFAMWENALEFKEMLG